MAFFNAFMEVYRIVPSPWNFVLAVLVGAGTLLYVASRFIRSVPQDQEGVRTRFRKVIFKNGKPIVCGPGAHFVVPWGYGLELINRLDQNFPLSNVTVRYGTYEMVEFSTSVVFTVQSVYKTKYAVQNFQERLTSACEEAVRMALGAFEQAEIDAQRTKVNDKFAELVAPLEQELGTSFRALSITNARPDTQALIAGAIASVGLEIRKGLETVGATLSQSN